MSEGWSGTFYTHHAHPRLIARDREQIKVFVRTRQRSVMHHVHPPDHECAIPHGVEFGCTIVRPELELG
jgi:hypothetical protein